MTAFIYITTASGRYGSAELYQWTGGRQDRKPEIPSKPRNTLTASLSFTQIISQSMQGSIELDMVYQNGYLGLPFHRVYYNTGKDTIESLPSQRFKLPIGFRLNYFLGDNIIIRSYYRFYVDSWGLISNTFNWKCLLR